jgi:putative protease
MLEKMGFSRVVLARELTLEEVAAIRAQTTMELEHFIHGALCFSFSGQCYFSSWLGGKSGNRGRCAQPCRRRYRYRKQEGYYFSTNDLSAIDLLPQLAAAGISSLKIEGRMKSAEYVANVVAAYRRALDASPGKRKEAVKAAKELLKHSFGRLPTKGFLAGPQPTDIASPAVKGATGRFLGEIAEIRGGAIRFKTRDRLHVGDRIRVQPKSDRAGTAFTVKEMRQGKGTVKVVQAGGHVLVPTSFSRNFKVGDAVFKVSSEQAFTLSEAACRRKLEGAARAPVPVRLRIALHGKTLVVQARGGGMALEREFPVETFPATEHPLTVETLKGVFARTAGEPFCLAELEAPALPPVVIPPRRLKQVRRELYQALGMELGAKRREHRQEGVTAGLQSLLPSQPMAGADKMHLSVAIGDLRDSHILNDPLVDRIFLPLTPGIVQGVSRYGRRLSGREHRVVGDLPVILFDRQWSQCQQAIDYLIERGFTTFRLNNLGHFRFFEKAPATRLLAGYRLFSLNSQAVCAWRDQGVAEITLYPEDDRDNLAQVLARKTGVLPLIQVYGTIPLITSRIPIRGVRSDQPVFSDRGEAYRVEGHSGLTVLRAETDFSLAGQLRCLQELGCGRFVVDLSHLGTFSARGKQILEAITKDTEIAGTSRFNFDTGLE